MHSSSQHQFANLAVSPFFHPAFSYAFRSIEASMPIHPAFLPGPALTPSEGHTSAFSATGAAANKGRSFTIDAILGHDSGNNGSSENRSSDEENDNIIQRRHRRFDSHPYLNALTSHLRFNTNQAVVDLQSQKEKADKICGKSDWKPTKSKRVRTIFTPEQLERLETEFERQQYMVGTERFYLASSLNLTEAQVKVWFQNRRIKWRKQNLEQQHAKLAKLNLLRVGDDDEDDEADSASENDANDDRRSESSSPVMHQYNNFLPTPSPIRTQSEQFSQYSMADNLVNTSTISPTYRNSSE